jgi:hypothetical protein
MRLGFNAASNRLEDILEKRRAGKRARDLAGVTVLAAMATLVNPYGFRLHAHIYLYLSNRFLMDHIDEFQSPNFHGMAQKCFAVLLLITLLTAAAKTRKLTMIEGLVVLFAVFSGLYASRNIPVASLLLVLVVGPLLSEAIEPAVERSDTSWRVRRAGTGLAVFPLAGASLGGRGLHHPFRSGGQRRQDSIHPTHECAFRQPALSRSSTNVSGTEWRARTGAGAGLLGRISNLSDISANLGGRRRPPRSVWRRILKVLLEVGECRARMGRLACELQHSPRAAAERFSARQYASRDRRMEADL